MKVEEDILIEEKVEEMINKGNDVEDSLVEVARSLVKERKVIKPKLSEVSPENRKTIKKKRDFFAKKQSIK